MKKKLFNLVAVAAMIISFPSCDDDDSAPGKLTFKGKSHDLSRAFGTLYDSWTTGDDTYYEWFIVLSSSGINFDETDEEFKGTGDAVTLYIYAKNDDSFIPPGTYTWDDETAYGEVYLSYNVETGDGEEYEDVVDTTVTITKSGSTYTITYTIEMDNGDIATGTYTGSIKEVEG